MSSSRARGAGSPASGTLPALAELGFDVVYLPPIHPIGLTNRKGRDNALTAAPGDPGSPWAIGSAEGGHEAVHPELGTLEDVAELTEAARELGNRDRARLRDPVLGRPPVAARAPRVVPPPPRRDAQVRREPAQALPGHLQRQLGHAGLARAVGGAARGRHAGWVDLGVKVFRVDNPHTKPFAFWEWLIGEVHARDRDVIFLAEAFTRRAVMRHLAKVGFSQSYTYFTWKNARWELTEYVTELAYSGEQEYFRPNFFVNTPDILHAYLQHGGRPAFEARLVLAATLSPSYGIYSGYENIETRPSGGLRGVSALGEVRGQEARARRAAAAADPHPQQARRAHPALQELSNVTFLETANDALIAYAKQSRGNTLITSWSTSIPIRRRRGRGRPAELGLPPVFTVHDLLSGERFQWRIGPTTSASSPACARPTSTWWRLCDRDRPPDAHAPDRPAERSRNPRLPAARVRRGAGPSRQWFESDPLWFKRAVFYEIHIRGFYDSNGDGLGDFRGLTEKLDYLQWLGVDCIWLLPFYPRRCATAATTSRTSQGAPRLRHVEDVREFIDAAHARKIRVIADLVMNHTSSEHPWFQESRSSPDSPKRDWYVWSTPTSRYSDARIIFVDTETSNWTWDPVAGAYYWHRFFSHQPDLNYDNPEVQEAMLDVLRFWLDLGLDGSASTRCPTCSSARAPTARTCPRRTPTSSASAREIDENYPDRVLLAEANQWPSDVVEYFGDGDECQMAFHFPVMPRMFMAVRREDAVPIYEILAQTPAIPDTCQWGLFLRNHDELTLEMVTDEERDYMYAEYAKDPRMKLNVGIRRRLAPLLDNGRDEIELMTAILFSLPGSPVLYYGDEIGMGDNVFLGDRDGVRTPMQWTATATAASRAPTSRSSTRRR
jgi:maltose alpha-D-glucosyltransferase/alpha-amylase